MLLLLLFFSNHCRFGSKTDAQSGGGRKGLRQRNQRTLRNGTNRPKRLRRKPRRAKARWTRTADSDRRTGHRPHVRAHIVESDVDSTTCWWCDQTLLPCCTLVHIYILLLILCPLFIFNLRFFFLLLNVTHARGRDARWID